MPRSIMSRTFAILVFQRLHRIPSKSNLSSPYSSKEWSSALTPAPVMIWTAEGLDLILPSSPQIASFPYSSGGILITFPSEASLGFCLVGFPHCCGPILLAWPTSEIHSTSPKHNGPRFNFFIPYLSPITLICRSYGLIGGRLVDCAKSISCTWSCELFSPTLLVISPLAKADEIINLKTIYEPFCLKSPPWVHLVSPFGNQCRLSRQSVPVIIIYINNTLKHLETEPTQRPQSGVVMPLFLLKPSRIMSNRYRQNSGLMFRTSRLPDLEGPWHPSSLTAKSSALPSSFMERNRPSSLAISWWFVPATLEAKHPSLTSQHLLIVTISNIPDLFAEVSSTHHDLACDMLLSSLCFRVSMNLSSKSIICSIYLMCGVSFYSITLYPLILPFWGLNE